ncbi:MAG TPA: T9SS type A sorting domain-containing protein [Chitinophagales bacterium]|nr:T9SS type A sorting domain-containing protein [Chitinophagales bacterium]
MKKLLSFLLLSFTMYLSAQTYPFAEGFEGLPNSQPPAGWGGGMKVLSYHGLNDMKGLVARLSSAVTEDSTITPLIGPLTSTSTLSFSYRIIDQNIYPSTPTNLDAGDTIKVLLSTDNVNYNTVFLINMDNHNTSFNFVKKKVFLSQYAGSNVTFKIHCQFGSGAGYYVDFDTIVVKNDPLAGIDGMDNSPQFSMFPNPSSSGTGCVIQQSAANTQQVYVFDAVGRQVFFSPSIAFIQLPVTNWQSGIYFVRAGTTTRKLIVE